MKPSFAQALGYIQEGEPLTLDLPNRNASIYTSSHFYLDDYPNASQPLSDVPMPHTTLNPAAAFETADEGYEGHEGVPFPRPPREFTRPSFLPDSDDGTAGTVGAAAGGLAVAGAGAALVGTAWAIEGGLNAASHLMGWGAATGGGTDSDASRPSMTTDILTLNGAQESGAVDHYFIEEQRRAQQSQPEVFRIDTESESEPRNRPLPQIRSRPARRPRPQAQTPFGLNNVPIPVSSGSEWSRVSRQSRGDRGPLGTQPFRRPSSGERTGSCIR